MTRDDIVTALRCCTDGSRCKCCNCELYCEKNCAGVLKNAAAALIEDLASDRKALINELCQYCGKYKQAHEGACDGCRWREM